jgi:hypothetical protein
MRVFLSYHSADEASAAALKAAIEAREGQTKVFFAPYALRGGAFWLPRLGEAIAEADAFLLLLGSRGVGEWQKIEYYEALDRRVREPAFPVVPVVTATTAPGLPFLRQLHFITTPAPDIDPQLATIIGALRGEEIGEAREPWRTTNPYPGLPALREEDAAFFFGREGKTAEILGAIEQNPGKLIALIGNSGVGKSSLVQAGIFGTLKRQCWPVSAAGGQAREEWPVRLQTSRTWVYLTARPGENPIRAVAAAFTGLWFEERGDPRRLAWTDGWEVRLNDRGRLAELIDDTQARYAEANVEPPARVVLYLDQLEELYAARLPRQTAERFSAIVAQALSDPRLLVLASQRSDYYGHLQADAKLFAATERIDVAPLDAAALKTVLSEPAKALGATFESDTLVALMVDAAEGQPGALPLLADHMSELWSRMQKRGDGVIRVADRSEIIQVSSALANRADRFLAEYGADAAAVKRLFCLKLTHVPREGEPVRRRLPRSECGEAEWQLIERMSQADWRLLVTGEAEGVAQAEIAHEVLLREWPSLKAWLLGEREFLAWKGEIEHARRQAETVHSGARTGALLMGRTLSQAEDWLARRGKDIGPAEQSFIHESLANRRQQGRVLRLVAALILLGVVAQPPAMLYVSQFRAKLIDARVESLLVQAEIIASAIAASATVDLDTTTFDPATLIEPRTGESNDPSSQTPAGHDFAISPDRVAPLLRRLISPTTTRARIFTRDGMLLLDNSSPLHVEVRDKLGLLERMIVAFNDRIGRETLPRYPDVEPQDGNGYPQVAQALDGSKSSMLQVNDRGEVIVAVAVPVQRLGAVAGALMISTQGDEIDRMVATEQLGLLKIFALFLPTSLVTIWLAFRLMRGVTGGRRPRTDE